MERKECLYFPIYLQIGYIQNSGKEGFLLMILNGVWEHLRKKTMVKLFYKGYHKRESVQNNFDFEDIVVNVKNISKFKQETGLFESQDCDCDYCMTHNIINYFGEVV